VDVFKGIVGLQRPARRRILLIVEDDKRLMECLGRRWKHDDAESARVSLHDPLQRFELPVEDNVYLIFAKVRLNPALLIARTASD
jgi:hypothetical protein